MQQALGRQDAPVLAADTAVVLDGLILGKPRDEADAADMLTRLSGREHDVLTSVAILDETREEVVVNRTSVRFRPLRPAEIGAYWRSGEPVRQGRRLRDPGARGRVHRGDTRQLFRGHGPAAVRNHAFTGRVRVSSASVEQCLSRPMSQEILINSTPREIRAALVEDGVLQDLLIERNACRGLIGNIYIGKVSRVLPGMQAAFVDIGIARTAFLHASDISPTERSADRGRPGHQRTRA